MRRPRLFVAVALAAAPAIASAQSAAPRPFAPADWYRLTTVGSPAVSPDGRLVAFTTTTVREAENKRHAEVWVVPSAGGQPVRYTSPGTESTNPRFSPDGKYLFFSSTRPGGKGSTWALRMDQPGGEAFQLPNYPAGSVTRDGRLAVWADTAAADSVADSTARARDPWTRMQAMARPPFGAITRPLDATRFDGRHVFDVTYKNNDRGFVPGRREARRWRAAQLWVQPIDELATRPDAVKNTAKRQITNTAYSHRGAVVSPDGRWIAFVADSALRPDSVVQAERDSLAQLPYDATRDERDRNESDVFVVPVAGGAPRRVVSLPGTESNVEWSPDGREIAFVNRPARMKNARLMVASVAGGAARNVVGDWRYEPDEFAWLPGGDLLVSASVGGRSALFRTGKAGGAPVELLGGRRRLSGFAFDAARRTVAYVATSVDKPTELYVASADGRNERRLTSFNDSLSAQIAWSGAERFTYPSVGGLEIEGWIMKPAGYVAGKKYPLVLYIHGGPHSQYNEGWFDEFQNLAGAGMMVLYTNPRGSSGYGADFTYVSRGQWGGEDYADLMKAVDIAAQRPDVDSTRMGVTGGSYGGFMTAWITTKTNRFKAAQADRMISDWVSWYGSSDAQGLTEFEFFGKPWDNFAMYDTLSPIRFVSKVRTPTLIVQSEEDHRTPMANAELWFMALKKQGVPVELVRYPRSTHELSRGGEPWLLVDRLGRLRQWFTYWLVEDRGATRTASDR
jgi:dipeptidyl aminopeptidase/acylaminoacyl peptidase